MTAHYTRWYCNLLWNVRFNFIRDNVIYSQPSRVLPDDGYVYQPKHVAIISLLIHISAQVGIIVTARKVYNAIFFSFEHFVLDYNLYCCPLDSGRL